MSSTTPFLKLPPELRNKIFEYTLTASEPLRYMAPREVPSTTDHKAFLFIPTGPHAPAWQATEFNQLKYTCRQLYTETAGLELKYNDIDVCGTTRFDKPGRQLLVWLSSMSPAKLRWINTITVTWEIIPETPVPISIPAFENMSLGRYTARRPDAVAREALDILDIDFSARLKAPKVKKDVKEMLGRVCEEYPNLTIKYDDLPYGWRKAHWT